MSGAPLDLFSAARQSIRGGSPEAPASVYDLTERTKALVESRLTPLWVRGEISDFKRHKNGHWYFCLRDRMASVRCVVWSKDQRKIPAPPDDGMAVVVFGQMTMFSQRGELQFKVTRMDAEGDGLRRKAIEMTLKRLRAEGLLDESRKREIPRYPRRIAIVTSSDAAALHDIVSILRNRNPCIEIVLSPAKVQGDGAPLAIASAIARVSKWSDADVLIVGRGGGSKEDLWAFNDERVARAVAASTMPVISAVGHEVDTTICDAVADRRAPTPSAAAALACVSREEMSKALAFARRDLSSALSTRVKASRNEFARTAERMSAAMNQQVVDHRRTLSESAGRLNALSPLAILGRGYAVARNEAGEALTSATDFAQNEKFELLLRDGRIRAETLDIVRKGPAN